MQPKQPPSARQKLIGAHLWQHLTLELGSAFKNQYGVAGGVEFNYWLEQLTGYSETTIAEALALFKASPETFISLKSFRAYCDEAIRRAAPTKEPEPLPTLYNAAGLKDSKGLAVGNQHLKAILGGRKDGNS